MNLSPNPPVRCALLLLRVIMIISCSVSLENSLHCQGISQSLLFILSPSPQKGRKHHIFPAIYHMLASAAFDRVSNRSGKTSATAKDFSQEEFAKIGAMLRECRAAGMSIKDMQSFTNTEDERTVLSKLPSKSNILGLTWNILCSLTKVMARCANHAWELCSKTLGNGCAMNSLSCHMYNQ